MFLINWRFVLPKCFGYRGFLSGAGASIFYYGSAKTAPQPQKALSRCFSSYPPSFLSPNATSLPLLATSPWHGRIKAFSAVPLALMRMQAQPAHSSLLPVS